VGEVRALAQHNVEHGNAADPNVGGEVVDLTEFEKP
jgi:hypothetical protein